MIFDFVKILYQNLIVVTHDDVIIFTFKRIQRIRAGRTYEEQGEGRS